MMGHSIPETCPAFETNKSPLFFKSVLVGLSDRVLTDIRSRYMSIKIAEPVHY